MQPNQSSVFSTTYPRFSVSSVYIDRGHFQESTEQKNQIPVGLSGGAAAGLTETRSSI